MAEPKDNLQMEKIVSLCKRRGFIFQSSEIYGGINGFWDYGPLGAELKRNVKELWWNAMTREREDVAGLEATIIMSPAIWKASGHVDTFSDPMCDCKKCKKRFRADQLCEDQGLTLIKNAAGKFELPAGTKCTGCGSTELTEPRPFNLMFKTYVGPVESEDNVAYLRPETAQAIFAQFKNVLETSRQRVPFGIAQVGKAFRNEVTPRNFTFRSREFEQMEIEFFCHPDESMKWYEYWRDTRVAWWKSLGLAGDNLQLREHDKDELAHYAKTGAGTSDVEYRFPFTAPGFGELEGIAHRSNFDLSQHQKMSKQNLEYFDAERGELLPNGQRKGEKYLPHVIEPSAGLDRGVLAVLCEAFTEDASRASPELMLIHPRLAPIKAAVFPLVNKEGMPDTSEKLHAELFKRFSRYGFVEHDVKQAIGKRYARMDEAGTPYCFTVDGDTAKDQSVTVRDRDSGGQERIAIDRVGNWLSEKLGLG